jgi:hypothetical protein
MQPKLLAMFLLLLSFCFELKAQGDLLVTPIRVVFEGKKQKEAINLVNVGKDTATYSISFLQYNMNEDGTFTSIEKPDSGQMFASPYLRIFPRKVTLAPGEPQVIMLQCRRSADMIEGEYRSHLYFRSEKNYKPLGSAINDTTLLSVQLIPVYGMSIPVIVRSGKVNTGSSLSNLSLESRSNLDQYLKLTIHRTGNISIYGDLVIEFIPTQGKPINAGGVNGVGVYTNIGQRNIVVKLNNTTGKPFTNGKLKVQFVSKGDAKSVIYAEAELEL